MPTSVQFSSVAQSCPTLCNPINRSTPGLPVYHKLPEFTQTHVRWVSDANPAISSSVVPFCTCPQSLPASGSFPMSQPFAWGGPSIVKGKKELFEFLVLWLILMPVSFLYVTICVLYLFFLWVVWFFIDL